MHALDSCLLKVVNETRVTLDEMTQHMLSIWCSCIHKCTRLCTQVSQRIKLNMSKLVIAEFSLIRSIFVVTAEVAEFTV